MKDLKMRYPKYSKYKHSGVEWLGEIPKGWEIKKVKRIGKTKAGGTPSTANMSYWDGNIPWIPSGKLQNCEINKADKFISKKGLEKSSTKLIRKNTTLIALTGATCANVGYLKFESTANQSVVAIEENNNTDSKFLFYGLINQRELILLNQTGGAQSGINEHNVRNIEIPIPTEKKEQTAIANFLEEKTAKIAKAIANKQKLIELLKERKQIIIQDLVTGKKVWNKNKNAWTEPAKVKDSGVEWIGKIPEHWEVKRLKYVSKITSNKIITRNTNLKYIGMENIQSWTGKYLKNNTDVDGVANYFKKGDILFGKLRPYLAKVYLAEEEGICSTEFLVLESYIHNKFLHFLMISNNFISIINSSTYGAKMPRANSEFIGNQLVALPKTEEQKEIVKYIEEQSIKIDKAILLQEKQIEKLKEFKQILIDSAVTGKIKIV